MGTILKRGYLTKEGGKIKSLKRRWFTLQGAVIYYTKSPEDTTQLGTIYLEDFRDVEATQERITLPNCFVLKSSSEKGRNFYLSADTKTDMDDWMRVIKTVVSELHKRHEPSNRRYVTVELFQTMRGIRISGRVHPFLIRALLGAEAQGENAQTGIVQAMPSNEDDKTVSPKRIDDRGWFCDCQVSVYHVLSVFAEHGWRLVTMYESPSLLPSSKSTLFPAIMFIYCNYEADISLKAVDMPAPASAEKSSVQLVKDMPGFRIEDGVQGRLQAQNDSSKESSLSSSIYVENPETETSWYRNFFLGKDHDIFVSSDRYDPFVVSIIFELDQSSTSDYYQYRVIVWTKLGKEQLLIPVEKNQRLNAAEIVETACPMYADRTSELRAITTPAEFTELSKDLIVMEEELSNINFKFGVLYVKKGQTEESQMFGNEHGSDEFNQFMDTIAEKVVLKGWEGFRGGLNTKNGTTGTHSYFAKFRGYNIMFHVSTLLPYSAVDTQQLERKRHIGNDIVTIIIQDEPGICFDPHTISSQFLHCFLVLEVAKDEASNPNYRINLVCNDKVPSFGPPLPNPPVLKPEEIRDFILAKLINAEKAASAAPAFQMRRSRTLKSLLGNMHSKFYENGKTKAHSKILDRPPLVIKRAEVVTAISNTKNMFSGLFWEDIPLDIRSLSIFGDKAVVGTVSNAFYFDGGSFLELKTEKGRVYGQLILRESDGIFVALGTAKNGHNFLFVHTLKGIGTPNAVCRRLEETKNCFGFHMGQLKATGELRLVVLVKKAFVVFVWQSTTLTFIRLKEIPVPDGVREFFQISGNDVIFATKTDFQAIDMRDGRIRPIPFPESLGSRVETNGIVTAHDEVLLSYNNVSFLISEQGTLTRNVLFKWTTTPHSAVYAFPYVFGLSAMSVEVRSVANGSLVETISLESTALLHYRVVNADVATGRPESSASEIVEMYLRTRSKKEGVSSVVLLRYSLKK